MKLKLEHAITHATAAASGAIITGFPLLAANQPKIFKLEPVYAAAFAASSATLIYILAVGTAGEIEEVKNP